MGNQRLPCWLAGEEMVAQPGWIRGSERLDCGVPAGGGQRSVGKGVGYLASVGYCAGCPTLEREGLFVFLLLSFCSLSSLCHYTSRQAPTGAARRRSGGMPPWSNNASVDYVKGTVIFQSQWL